MAAAYSAADLIISRAGAGSISEFCFCLLYTSFLIPKRYLKLAKIQQDVRFIGLDDTIEIWSKELADKPFSTPEDFGKELEEIMGTNNNVEIE